MVQIAVAIERIEQLREEVRGLKKERHAETEQLRTEILALKNNVDALRARTDKWKWGLLTMGGLGAVFMYVLDVGTKIAGLLTKVIR